MNALPSTSSIQDLVMDVCLDPFYSDRMVTGGRLYSAIDTAEMLHEKNFTYSGTINKNRKGLPTEIKTVKEQENDSSPFF